MAPSFPVDLILTVDWTLLCLLKFIRRRDLIPTNTIIRLYVGTAQYTPLATVYGTYPPKKSCPTVRTEIIAMRYHPTNKRWVKLTIRVNFDDWEISSNSYLTDNVDFWRRNLKLNHIWVMVHEWVNYLVFRRLWTNKSTQLLMKLVIST